MKSLLQTPEWARLRQGFGWQAHWVDEILILEKKLPMGKTFLYAPEVEYNATKLQNFCENTKKIAEKSHAIFFRLEILDENRPEIIENLKTIGFVKAFEELQPEWRQIIDISKSEDEILSQMKPKGRYNIKIAEKHRVKVEKITEESLLESIDTFYNLFRETAENQGFAIRPKKYFQDLLFNLCGKRYADLFIASYNGTPVCGLIITYFDGVASYLYGASSKENRQVMAPYLAHWEVIREAKRRGCNRYDLLAVEPKREMGNEKGEMRETSDSSSHISHLAPHKYAGITRFKEQFGGRKIQIVGSYDLIYQPFWYKMFKILEKRRRN